MKLILHHFWKDIRSLRWILGLWLLVVLTQAVITVLAVQPSYQIASVAEAISSSAIWYVIDGAIWTAVIVYLIQSELVTGDTSFWLTRPIPPIISVLSKLIFIVGLVVVPSLVPRTMDLLLFGVQVRFVNDTVCALVVIELILALCVVWLATYTRNMAQFWGVIGMLCVLWIVASLTFMFRNSMMTFSAVSNPVLWISRFEMAFWVFLAGLILSLVIQYAFRATSKAFLLGVAGIFLALVCLLWWPFVLPRIGHGVAHPPSTKTLQLAYQLDAAKPFTWNSTQLLGARYDGASVTFLPPPAPDDAIPFIRSIGSSFQPADGKKLLFPAAIESYSYFTTDRLDWSSLLRHDNPQLTIEGYATPDNEPIPTFRLSSEQSGDLKDQTGTLDFNIHGDLLSLQKQAEIALNGAGFARIPSALVRLIAIQNDKNGINLSVEEIGYRDVLKWKSLPTVYFLVDPKNGIGIIPRKTVVTSQANTVGGGTLNRMSAVLNLEVRATDLPESLRTSWEEGGVNQMILYVYEATSQNSFESEVKISDYTFHPGER